MDDNKETLSEEAKLAGHKRISQIRTKSQVVKLLNNIMMEAECIKPLLHIKCVVKIIYRNFGEISVTSLLYWLFLKVLFLLRSGNDILFD